MKKYILQFKGRNLLVSILLIMMAFLQISTNLINAVALQRLIEFNLQSFLLWYALFLVIWLLFLVVMRIEKVQEQIVTQKMSTAIRHDISVGIKRMDYQEFHRHPTNVYSSEYSNDLNLIEQSGFTNFYGAISSVANVVFATLALATVHYSLIITTIVMAVLLVGIPKLFSKKLQQANVAVTEENGRFLGKVTDVLDGFNVLFSSGLTQLLVAKIETQSQQLERVKVDATRKQTNIEIVITFVNVLAQFAVIVQTGILAGLQLIPIGAIGGTGGLAGAVFNGLGQLGNNVMQLKSVQPLWAKFQVTAESEQSTSVVPKLTHQLSLHQVSYRVQHQQILKDLSLTFQAGGKYAIVGPSGSGKSTLLNLINGRIQPEHGNLEYDGMSYAELDLERLRQRMILIDQNPYIFHETLRENITLGNHYSAAELQRVLNIAHLQDLVQKLPQGLDTVLERGGTNLSGGEKQRITIARGLITGKEIFLMDESTAALDEQTATEIETTLVHQPAITLLMVTHHLQQKIREQLTNVIEINAESN